MRRIKVRKARVDLWENAWKAGFSEGRIKGMEEKGETTRKLLIRITELNEENSILQRRNEQAAVATYKVTKQLDAVLKRKTTNANRALRRRKLLENGSLRDPFEED